MIRLFIIFLAGCSSLVTEPSQQLDPNTLYKRDMIVTVNGVTFEGVGVAPMLDVNQFHIIARGDLNLFVMSTCHRETTKESAWNVQTTVPDGLFGWGSKKVDSTREATFSYKPVVGIEDGIACPLELSGFDKAGRHSWAFVDFVTKDMTLPGKIGCNGASRDFVGVEACQSRSGLYQTIDFPVPVMVSPDRGCELPAQDSGRFKFPVNKGKCVYIFKEVKGPRLARITTIGYESILVRDN